MMETKDLIKTLRECVFENQYNCYGGENGAAIMLEAADHLEQLEERFEAVQAEAIKEFVERLKLKAYRLQMRAVTIYADEIDNLVKEMAGENNED